LVTATNPCPDAAWVGELKFTPSSGGNPVDIKTDKAGKFGVALAPDSYRIALIGPNPMDAGAYETLPVFRGPSTLEVHAGQAVDVEFAVETGIR
jgi:hypothetical protein